MIRLQLFLGSASYGLKTETSDTDVYIIGSGSYRMPEGDRPHILVDTKENFVSKALLDHKKHPIFLQTLFPAEFMLETDAAKYVQETREDVVRAHLGKVYEAYMTVGTSLLNTADVLYTAFPKRIAYGTLFLDTVYRYAQGSTFAEASRPEEDFRQWLLAVRKKQVPLNEILAVCEEKKKLAASVAGFYDREPDPVFLETWKNDMLDLLSD